MAYGDSDLREESMGELIKRLMSDMSLLVRQEFELFRTEMTAQTKRAGKQVGIGAGMLSGAAVAGLFGLACLTTAVILLLALVMPAWGAALICTVIYGVVAAVMAVSGKRTLEEFEAPVPHQTIETVKEDVEWAKTRTSSAPK